MATTSVIIPAYNAALSLRASVDSALAQQPRPAQVIVINDGSTDNTAEVARSFGDRIVYLEQENSGQGAARNAGLAVATGDNVAFLDADDYWKPGFLATCLDYLVAHPEVCAVSTMLVIRYADGTERILPPSLNGGARPPEPFVIDRFFDFWAKHDHIRTGSNVIRMNVIREAGGQRADLRVSQDLEYWGYIATFGKWAFIPEPLWVGNSRAAAVAPGWLNKYRKRRSLCPTVESWEQRIAPRLKPGEHVGFAIVRGRVAAGYAHNKILGGDLAGAMHIVRRYGKDMPQSRVSCLLLAGASLGRPGWWAVCRLVIMREHLKAFRMRHTARLLPADTTLVAD